LDLKIRSVREDWTGPPKLEVSIGAEDAKVAQGDMVDDDGGNR
jgi:hypothetical protein